MKHYGRIFDIFLYQSVFVFLFGCLLYLLNDPISFTLFTISVTSAVIAVCMGITGLYFNLFTKEPKEF
ncbi:MAG TPA: hypothetical protein VI548_06320 [Chitinophagaceae bacterium]|nr:hypothetical protein [Chitinophagaceae bacterium]